MRYVLVLIIVISFVTNTLPAFAAGKSKGEKSLFQIAGDTISEGKSTLPEKDKIRSIEKIDFFQRIADIIKEGSAKAKNLSLRGKK